MSMSRCETGGCCGLLGGLLGTSINQIQTIYIHLQSCLHAPTHRDKDACPHTIRAGAEVELGTSSGLLKFFLVFREEV